MMAGAYNENYYVALLGLAESFRTSNPPNYRLSIQCLQAIFNFQLPTHLQALAHFYYGRVLHQYTRNEDFARVHLERAFAVSAPIRGFEEIRVQIACTLAEIYLNQRHIESCRQTISQVLEISSQFAFWRCRLLFQLAEAAICERDFSTAYRYLDVGADFCASMGVLYTESLFRLSKGMLLLVDPEKGSASLQKVHTILQQVTQAVNSNSIQSPSRKEHLKAFFLILQVCHFLMTGGVKGSKACLKQLQISIQSITARHEGDEAGGSLCSTAEFFHWLPKEELCIFVYLVTVVHAMQGGQMERAQKYTEKALNQIEKLRAHGKGKETLLSTFQVLLLEHSAMCRMVVGQPSIAIQDVARMCQIVQAKPKLFTTHESQLHTLLGLYGMIMREPDAAEKQFNTALRVTKDIDLWSFVNLNLAVVYLQAGRDQDFYLILERITPERLRTNSESLKAAAHYVRGLQSFFQNRYQEAKRYLKDALALSNNEDLSRISTSALVLLGHIFLKYQNIQECSNMLSPALELANRIPDLTYQIWANYLVKELYVLYKDVKRAEEARQTHEAYLHRLEKEMGKARVTPEHALLNWVEGPCMFQTGSGSL